MASISLLCRLAVTGANVCVDAGGKLDLSSNVYICGSQLVNRGLVTGVATIDACASDSSGGFYYLSKPDGSTACGTAPVDGKVGGCMTEDNPSYSPLATVDDGCGSTSTGLAGCTFPIATNYKYPLQQPGPNRDLCQVHYFLFAVV